MRLSVSTLARMRVSGTGPDYFQLGVRQDGKSPKRSESVEQAEGTNQHILYFKEDIAAWFKSGKVSKSQAAAIRKGQLRSFVTLADALEELPFYIDPMGRIEACVEDLPMETLLERLDVWEIEWLPAVEAASRVWSDQIAQRRMVDALRPAIQNALAGLDAGLEASDLDAQSRKS